MDNSSLLKFIEIQRTLINFNKFLINFNCQLSEGDNCDDHRYVLQESQIRVPTKTGTLERYGRHSLRVCPDATTAI